MVVIIDPYGGGDKPLPKLRPVEVIPAEVRGRQLFVLRDPEMIAEEEEEIRADLKEDDRARLLMTLPGVGEILAYAILAEIGEVERFPNPRALAAYAGLLPQANESGGKDFGRRTAKQCNRFLRWAMIEGVTGAVRKSPRMKSLHSRAKARNKKTAGKARVAVARELVELVHLLLSGGVPYTEKRPPRPGSERSRKGSRPNRASRASLCARPARGQADM